MTLPTKRLVRDENIDLMRALVERADPDGQLVSRISPVGFDASVELELETPDGPVVAVVENADPGRGAFERTASFLVWHRGSPPFAATEVLRAFVRRLAASDPGGLSLRRADHVGYLPVFAEKGFERDPIWKRGTFDRNLAALPAEERVASAVTIVVTQACKMDCIFCPSSDRSGLNIAGEGVTTEDLFADVVHQLEAGRALGARGVDLAASDMLLFPYALEIFRKAKALGYTRIAIETIGQSMADAAFAKEVRDAGCTDLRTPIYGATAAAHDEVVSVPGSFDMLQQGLRNARALGGPQFQLHTIALKRSLHRLVDLIDWVWSEHGIALRVDHLQPNRDGQEELMAEMVGMDALRPVIAQRPMHFVDFALCQLPADAALEMYRVKKQAEAEGRLARAPMHLYDLGLSSNSMHPRARASRQRGPQLPQCSSCLVREVCPGPMGMYAMQHGSGDFVPFTDPAAVAEALARTGEPFPTVAIPASQKLDLIAPPVDAAGTPAQA